jgi:hypothetical protein
MEKNVHMVFDRKTTKMARYNTAEMGVVYVPQRWFTGEPPESMDAVFTW